MSTPTVSEPQTSSILSPAQRIERLVVVVAFLGLILTGLPQRYANQEWSHLLIVLGGGVESLRILHRFFALLLLAEVLYHILAVSYRWFVVGHHPVMFPGIGDVGTLIQRVLTNLGLRREDTSPNYGFVLKIEYLVIVTGVVVLGITGLTLWNPIAISSVFPGETIPIARSVHSDHALFTTLMLVLLRLGIGLLWRPKRAAIFTHIAPASLPAGRVNARRRLFLPIAIVVAFLSVVAMVLFLNSEQTAISTVPRRQEVIFAPQTIPETGDPHIGEVIWETSRCAFCHGETADGGINGEPSLHRSDLTFEAFYEQVRVGRGEMPAFTAEELPDGYLVHLWAWLTQPGD